MAHPTLKICMASLSTSKPFIVIEHNEDFIVVNKAAGIVSQGADSAHNLLSSLKESFQLDDVFPVHRLDKDTSGLMVLAKTQIANKTLSSQFQDGLIKKFYLALTNKKGKKKQGWIKGDMQKGRSGNWMLSQTMDNPASTYFFSYGFENGRRINIIKPITGKTHQIRVALKSVGTPILGDERYGGELADRLYLHAFKLGFEFNNQVYQYSAMPNFGQFFAVDSLCSKLKQIGPIENLPWPK